MKKFIMVFVVFVFMCAIVHADCNITNGNITYSPNVNAPSIINYQTGEGYCLPSVNPGGVVIDLTKCDRVNDLIPGEDYVIVQEIKTEGFAFLNPAEDATNISIAVKAFISESDLCDDVNGIEIELDCDLVSGRLVSEISDEFILVARPFILVEIPSVSYNKETVNGDNLSVSVGFNDANVICITCEQSICKSTFDIGKLSCLDSYSLLFPYGVCNQDDWWTGIVVTNLTSENGSMDVIIYVDGFKYKTVMTVQSNSVKTMNIDELLSDAPIDGTTCYVEVNSNFEMDGVGIYGNSIGHSAFLARKK